MKMREEEEKMKIERKKPYLGFIKISLLNRNV